MSRLSATGSNISAAKLAKKMTSIINAILAHTLKRMWVFVVHVFSKKNIWTMIILRFRMKSRFVAVEIISYQRKVLFVRAIAKIEYRCPWMEKSRGSLSFTFSSSYFLSKNTNSLDCSLTLSNTMDNLCSNS